MMDYQTIQTHLEDNVFRITLNREQKRNAISEQTMDELLDALSAFPAEGKVPVAVLTANGNDFCAGADLDWMRSTQGLTVDELQKQNAKLEKVFRLWYDLPAFTIVVVQGNIVGGGIGLVAASDLVVARPSAMFRFSELNLGLIPATIAPYVLQRTSSRFIRNAMLTAKPFDAAEALKHELVDLVADTSLAKTIVDEHIGLIMNNETAAMAKCKQLLNDLVLNRVQGDRAEYTTRLLAEVRKSDAAARRIELFFNKSRNK